MSQSKSIEEIRKAHPEWEFPDFAEKSYKSKQNKYCVVVFVINEGERIQSQLKKMKKFAEQTDIVIADGGSTDDSLEDSFLRKNEVNTLLTKMGPGKLSAQMRMAFAWALVRGYEGIVVVDGNNKDDTSALPNFIKLLNEGYDHIQGSRFIPGGKALNTPLSREVGLHLIHAPLISLASRRRHTDTTNGFRAYSSRLLMDGNINIFRDIFQTYELHYYLAIEASRRKPYRVIETPVVREYPKKGKTPTKISPLKGNLHIMKVLLSVVSGKYREKNDSVKSNIRMRRWSVLTALFAGIGVILSTIVFYPGYMSPDSISQYGQATGLFTLQDWHPPSMTLLWGWLMDITGVTGSMLFFQLMMLWSAVWLLSYAIYRKTKSGPLSLLPFILPVLPYVGNFAGVIWKDVHMAYALLLVASVIICLTVLYKETKTWQKTTLLLIGFAGLFYALTVRHNAIFAVVPMLVLILRLMPLNKKSLIFIFMGFFIFSFSLIHLVGRAANVEESHPTTSVMLDDIVNVSSIDSIVNSKIAPSLKTSLISVKGCLTEEVYLNLYWLCATAEDRQNISVWYPDDVRKIWSESVLGAPLQYLVYRVQSFFWFLFPPSAYVWQQGIDDNELGLGVRTPRLGDAVSYYVEAAHRNFGFLFEGWFWLLTAMAMAYYALRKMILFRPLVLGLTSSSILYVLAYAPVVVATDYRYIYWPAIACTLALALIYLDHRDRTYSKVTTYTAHRKGLN